MAKQKREILVCELLICINIWIDEPEKALEDINRIEGVSNAFFSVGNVIHVYVDPRYDKADVADEIRELLASDVPDVSRAENV